MKDMKEFLKMFLCTIVGKMENDLRIVLTFCNVSQVKNILLSTYVSLLNLGQLYHSLEPTLVVGDPFNKIYSDVAVLCKACKKYSYNDAPGTSERIFDCRQCSNYEAKEIEHLTIQPDIMVCKNYVPDVLTLINNVKKD